MAEEDEEWVQTSITITPEDDAVVREIADATLLSAGSNVPLEISAENIVYHQPIASRQFMDPEESEVVPSINIEETQINATIDPEGNPTDELVNPEEEQMQSEDPVDLEQLEVEEILEPGSTDPGQDVEQSVILEETTSADLEVPPVESEEYYTALEAVQEESADKSESLKEEEREHSVALETSEPEKVKAAKEFKDAENQTYLQGVPEVDLQIDYKDEASQTMYTSAPCPPLEYHKEIMRSMSDSSMPLLKKSIATMTIIKLPPGTPKDTVMSELSRDHDTEEIEEFQAKPSEREQMDVEVTDILNFILTWAFWVKDPMNQKVGEKKDEIVQTSIRYNYCTKKMMLDSEAQTGLTCEPKLSNTKLLSDYQNVKTFIVDFLDACICTGIEPRILVSGIIDEILNECSERIRLPMRDQILQTVASYKLQEEKEEDILKKLRLERVIDPLEASTVVQTLINDLLDSVRNFISKNAPIIVNDILKLLLRRTTCTIKKLIEIEQESKPKPKDDMFNQRRKKILELLSKKVTKTTAAQTDIAGVPEINKHQESREILCSVCRKGSACRWCFDQESGETAFQENTVLRTQDILLAYKPCYVVATLSDSKKNPELHPACPPQVKMKRSPPMPVCICEKRSTSSSETMNVVLQPKKKLKTRDSNSWSRVVETALAKPWSVKGSTSDDSETALHSSSMSSVKLSCKKSFKIELTSNVAKTLELLKNTFCTKGTCGPFSRETLCKGSLCQDESTFKESICHTCSSYDMTVCDTLEDRVCCTQEICDGHGSICSTEKEESDYLNAWRNNVNELDGEFKVIPVCFFCKSKF